MRRPGQSLRGDPSSIQVLGLRPSWLISEQARQYAYTLANRHQAPCPMPVSVQDCTPLWKTVNHGPRIRKLLHDEETRTRRSPRRAPAGCPGQAGWRGDDTETHAEGAIDQLRKESNRRNARKSCSLSFPRVEPMTGMLRLKLSLRTRTVRLQKDLTWMLRFVQRQRRIPEILIIRSGQPSERVRAFGTSRPQAHRQ